MVEFFGADDKKGQGLGVGKTGSKKKEREKEANGKERGGGSISREGGWDMESPV